MNCPFCNEQASIHRTVADNYVEIVCQNPSCDKFNIKQHAREQREEQKY